ncbi:MAG: LysE family transporter [Acidilobaceae archaeon]
MARELLALLLLTLAITPTGALAPGPLSASALASGASLGVAGGVAVAVGHALFELPYVVLLYKTLESVESGIRRLRPYMTVAAIIFMLYFAYLLASSALDVYSTGALEVDAGVRSVKLTEALVAGLALTGLNAHFLLWWVTVGYPLIAESRRLGYAGLAAMYVVHVSIDFAWLAFLAAVGSAAGSIDYRVYAALLLLLAAFLALFAVRMALREFRDRTVSRDSSSSR